MLPVPLHQLDEALLQRVCSEQWPESQTLDFKAVLPGTDETSRTEFRKDVTAFANADGGDIVYGVSEASGTAAAINPITGSDADGVKRRLKQILEANLEPRLSGIQYGHIDLAGGGFVLVVRVPSSLDGPHRFSIPPNHRFVIRDGTGTSQMTFDQLRTGFGRGPALVEAAHQFVLKRLGDAVTKNTPYKLSPDPVMALHIVPINGIAGRVSVDVQNISRDHQVLRVDPSYVWKRTPTLSGVLMYPYEDPEGPEAYSQLYRNGVFELMYQVWANIRSDQKYVLGQKIGERLRGAITAYAEASGRLGVAGQALIFLTVINTSQTLLHYGRQATTGRPQREFELNVPPVMMEDVSSIAELDSVSQLLMDVIYQAYGLYRCDLFSPDGKWTPF